MKIQRWLLRRFLQWLIRPVALVLTMIAIQLGSPAVVRAQASDRASAEVRLGEHVVCLLQEQEGLPPVEVRARVASEHLENVLRSADNPELRLQLQDPKLPGSVRSASIFSGEVLLFRITELDAQGVGEAHTEVYARRTFATVRRLLAEERKRSQIAKKVLSVSTVVFLGLLLLLLLRFVRAWSRRGRRLVKHQAKTIGAVRLGTVELLPAQAARESLRVALTIGSWFFQAVLVYAWVVTSLSLFESTREFAEKSTGTLFGPALELLQRLASQVPVLFALAFALVVVGLVVRFTGAYFSAIERRDVEVDWVRPGSARVTGGLLSLGIAISALLFVAPLLTGSDNGVLTRVGELALSIFALSVVPMLASCVLGVRLVYVHVLRIGDRVSYGGHTGLVERIGIFALVIQGDEGQTIFVPHLFSLWHATQIFVRGTRPSIPPSDVGLPPSSGEDDR